MSASSTRPAKSPASTSSSPRKRSTCCRPSSTRASATLQEIEQARLDENDKWVAFLDADFARQQAQLALLQATGQLAKVFQQ